MPREKVTDKTTAGFYTEVFWRRRPGLAPDDQGTSPGHVQIASVNVLSPFHFPDVETDGHFEAGEKFDGWRITLDAEGIDHLIKTLHKAKRQAFGEAPPQLPAGPIQVIGDEQVAAAERGVYLPGEGRTV